MTDAQESTGDIPSTFPRDGEEQSAGSVVKDEQTGSRSPSGLALGKNYAALTRTWFIESGCSSIKEYQWGFGSAFVLSLLRLDYQETIYSQVWHTLELREKYDDPI